MCLLISKVCESTEDHFKSLEMSDTGSEESHSQIKCSCGVDYDDADDDARANDPLAASPMAQCGVCLSWCHRECFGLPAIEEDSAPESTKAGDVFKTDDGSQFYCSDQCLKAGGNRNAHPASPKRKRKSSGKNEVDFPIFRLTIRPHRLLVSQSVSWSSSNERLQRIHFDSAAE